MNRSTPNQSKPAAAAVASYGSAHPLLQRKCACGGSPDLAGECEECRENRLQRKTCRSGFVAEKEIEIPSVVHEVLRSPGQPLDPVTLGFMEPRFGHDFSDVRVHTDSQAGMAARAVNALAFTVGRELVFGNGRYQPSTIEGRGLVAHELTHVVQQGNRDRTVHDLSLGRDDDGNERQASAIANALSVPTAQMELPIDQIVSTMPAAPGIPIALQRACLPAADCAAPRATLTEFVAETQKKPENVARAEKRKKACTKVPPDPSCTSDGHGAPATALTAILKANYASRLGYVTGIFVNKDMPATWGAVTAGCANFMPPLPGGKCTFVPDTLEAQGKLYQGGAGKVGGQPRQIWLTDTIGTLTHETEHARFGAAAPIPQPSPAACNFNDQKHNLSEMAAHLSEMHVYYRDALAQPSKGRFKRFYEKFDFWVKNGSEDISGIVKELRCKCECADADYFITKTAESVAANQKWDSNEKSMIHTELRQPKWALKWPVAPPGAIDVNDLPTVAASPLKFE